MTVYHRLGNPRSQNFRTAIKQRKSQQIWGGVPRGSDKPAVQAYFGSLPDGREGIEFAVELKPNQNIAGFEARWSYRDDYERHLSVVDVNPDKVSLRVTVIKAVYGCRK